MKDLIIDRSKWRFGGDFDNLDEKYGSTELLNSKGYMCCLGFFSKDLCDVPEECLEGVPTPRTISRKYRTNVEILLSNSESSYAGDSLFSKEAVEINDAFRGEKEERELLIINHFKKIDVSVSFINEYPE
jgi:hypothetical protein